MNKLTLAVVAAVAFALLAFVVPSVKAELSGFSGKLDAQIAAHR